MDERLKPQTGSRFRLVQAWLVRICLTVTALLIAAVAVRVARTPATIEGVVVFNRQTRGHDDHFEAASSELPPVGGVHHNRFQNCGSYSAPIDLEKAIHSLEHGAVWITYHPDLPADDIDYLQAIIRGEDYFLLSPYPDQRRQVVLTAWGAQLELDSVLDERFHQFLARYLLGPSTPERGASCKGGFGEPLS